MSLVVHALRVAQGSRAQVFIARPSGQAEDGAVPGADVVPRVSRGGVLQRTVNNRQNRNCHHMAQQNLDLECISSSRRNSPPQVWNSNAASGVRLRY